jgi:hypothetical protein
MSESVCSQANEHAQPRTVSRQAPMNPRQTLCAATASTPSALLCSGAPACGRSCCYSGNSSRHASRWGQRPVQLTGPTRPPAHKDRSAGWMSKEGRAAAAASAAWREPLIVGLMLACGRSRSGTALRGRWRPARKWVGAGALVEAYCGCCRRVLQGPAFESLAGQGGGDLET